MKICSRCKKEFPQTSEFFHKSAIHSSGFNHRCKPCASGYVLTLQQNRTYNSFRSARERCTNPRHKSFSYYGGRGIKFLLTTWQALEKEIGPRPVGSSLDRIDTNGHYETGNVKWSTRRQQSRNTRSNWCTEELALYIRKLFLEGFRIHEIASRLGKRPERIGEIISGKTWRVDE